MQYNTYFICPLAGRL